MPPRGERPCPPDAAAYGAMWASPPTHRLPKSHASHSGGQTRPPLHPSTERPPCFFSVIPRARSACGNPSPVSCQQRPKAATYLCRSAAKARFDNRQPPEGVSKEGGPQPSLFGRSRMGDFQGGRKIETSFPLEWRFWLLLSLLTKVTRRRQKKKNIPGGQARPPLHPSTERRPVFSLSFRGRKAPVGIRIPAPAGAASQKPTRTSGCAGGPVLSSHIIYPAPRAGKIASPPLRTSGYAPVSTSA